MTEIKLNLYRKNNQMADSILIKNAYVVNEGLIRLSDVLIQNGRFEKIANSVSVNEAQIIDANGLFLLPGCIDDQVHFREPGYPEKADMHTESCAAAAGGVTSYMEMPNTVPNTLTQELLEEKYQRASQKSVVNYSFYMGTSNDNAEEVLKTNLSNVCGVKIFMGASTGNMLVDNERTLNFIFANSESLIAVHCEDELIIKNNLAKLRNRGVKFDAGLHPQIRDRSACFSSSSHAIALAKKHGTRLHVLHISTKDELKLFNPGSDPLQKKITAEACVHHMFFSDEDYVELGNKIKCNPAIKSKEDRDAIRLALQSNIIDVVATDHAPHTIIEKQQEYAMAPAGLPLVQHPVLMMLTIADEMQWPLTFLAEKMSHQVARLFQIKERGFIREGYHADFYLLDPDKSTTVSKHQLLYKCGWSPLEGRTLRGRISSTWVNGKEVYNGETVNDNIRGERLIFSRN